MRVVLKLLTLTRYLILSRQLREMRKLIDALPITARKALGSLTTDELQRAAQAPFPHLYGSELPERYQPWGDATEQALLRARSNVPQIKLRAMALWLTVVYHETENSPHPGLQGIHRDVLGVLGDIRGTYRAAAALRAQAA